MIHEERVKEMYHMAVFDEREEKDCHWMGEYYIWDYVGKELVKSFFSGTIAFVLLVVLWGMGDLTARMEMLNQAQLADLITRIGVLYVAFLAVYLLVTAIVYTIRYVNGRKKLRGYAQHLKRARKLGRQEERR